MPRRQSRRLLKYRLGRVKTTESRSWTITTYCVVSQRRLGLSMGSQAYTIADLLQMLQDAWQRIVMRRQLRLARRIE